MTLKLGMQHPVHEYYQVCSNDDPGLTLTFFTARSNLVPYAFVWEKGKTMDFSETIVVSDLKLATDDLSDKTFLLTSKLCPWGYIHVLNHEKNIYIIKFQRDFFETCKKMGEVIKPFSWHQNIVPWGLSVPAPGLYTCNKSWKNCIKSDFKDIFFKTCNKWPKWQVVPVGIKICPHGVVSPCPGAIYMYKNHEKNCIKSDFIEIFF